VGTDRSQNTSCADRSAVVLRQMRSISATALLTLLSGWSGREGSCNRRSSAAFRPSVVTSNMLSSRGSTWPVRNASARSTSEATISFNSGEHGALMTVGLPPRKSGTGSLSMAWVWMSATCRNICKSSGTFTNRQNLECNL